MTAPGFCTCKRDFPERRSFHPPIGATWHFLCDKPVLPPYRPDNSCQVCGSLPVTIHDGPSTRYGPACGHGSHPRPRLRETGTGWPVK